jgi:hypothetical protein
MIDLAANIIRCLPALACYSSNPRIRRQVLISVHMSWVTLSCATVCLLASVAQAQQLLADDLSAGSTATGSGCLSPQRNEPNGVIAHPQGSSGHRIRSSDTTLMPSKSAAACYRSISQADNPIGNQSARKLRFEPERVNPGSMAAGSLIFPESFLSLLQSKYMAWESRLEDSEARTNVNGRLVYPLLQVNYAGWHLPVTLYIPPLRGSDARR